MIDAVLRCDYVIGYTYSTRSSVPLHDMYLLMKKNRKKVRWGPI